MAGLAIGDKAVAQVAITAVVEQLVSDGDEVSTYGDPGAFAAGILAAAERVQYQPSSRRLVLTFDLSGPSAQEPPQA